MILRLVVCIDTQKQKYDEARYKIQALYIQIYHALFGQPQKVFQVRSFQYKATETLTK
jgi:hypothetical protein